MRKRKKQWGLSFKKIGDDLIAQKPMTLFKQIARHMMAFFEIKSTYSNDFLKISHNAIMYFVSNFIITLCINDVGL
jgi:6-phosphogluconate dehydrogenase (decarboxylating)